MGGGRRRSRRKKVSTSFTAHLPGLTCSLVISIFSLHRSVYFANGQPFSWATEDSASEDDGEGVLWSAIGVWEAIEGVWTIWMRFVVAMHDNLLLLRRCWSVGGRGCRNVVAVDGGGVHVWVGTKKERGGRWVSEGHGVRLWAG